MLDALWTHKFEAGSLSTEIGDWFLFMLFARLIVAEVSLHVFQGESFFHWIIMNIDANLND